MASPSDNLLTLVGVGDLHPNGANPEDYFQHCGSILRQADIAFGQFEGTISPDNTYEAYSPQPIMLCREPAVATALANAGFDILSTASNHAMDGGSKGLLDTAKLFHSLGMKTVGAGANLEEARRPVILESKGIRIAFVASCSTMPVGYEADVDRAGVAPLRATQSYEQVDYQPGMPPLIRTECNPEDLQAIIKSVRDVRKKADIVVVSFHFGIHLVPEFISDYEGVAAHAVIDEGADLVLGHHPHILKGIEVYKGKVIFYSLGNFALDVSKSFTKPAMHWFYNACTAAFSGGKRFKGYPWLYLNEVDPEDSRRLINIDSRKTMIAKAVFRGNNVERVSFLPAIITGQHVPIVLTRQDPRAQEVLDYVKRLTRSQGLEATFDWDVDEVLVTA